VKLPREAVAAMVAHARRSAPAECCGVLVGAGDRVIEAVPAKNLSPDPNRFLLDPRTHIAAEREARGRGLAVVGFYHSHPHSAARPSPTDIAEASYAEAVHVIVSLAGSEPSVGVFKIGGDGAKSVPFEVTEE
jgi:proteasome lid subunit RPN8/RPN11